MGSVTAQGQDAIAWPAASLATRWRRALWRLGWRLRRRLGWGIERGLRLEPFAGFRLLVLPGVFNGVHLRTGAFLAETLQGLAWSAGTRVLDLGTGSGLGAVAAARAGAQVTATDINPDAVRCAQVNALIHHLDQRIDARVGDLFDPVQGERFDLVLFNPPYYRGRPRDLPDAAWRSPDAFDRFLQQLPAHLTPDGRAFVVLSTDGDRDMASALGAAPQLLARRIRERDFGNETLTVYELRSVS
jgi:HemK-related putative methylase